MLTDQEAIVAMALGAAWNHFLVLPEEHPDDVDEFRRAIHAAQNIVLSRSGRRQINTDSPSAIIKVSIPVE